MEHQMFMKMLVLAVLLGLLSLIRTTNAGFVVQPLHAAPMRSRRLSMDPEACGKTHMQGSSKSKDIMNIIKTRYGDEDPSSWTKTRNYVYHATLTTEQAQDVMSFLDQVFPEDPALVRSILSNSPRILRKDVKTHLQPTKQFLQQLYGPEMFREAISRNPDLLLASGVGYGGPNNEMDSYLVDELDLSSRNVRKLKESAPFLFRLSAQKVGAVIAFLSSILERGGYHDHDRRRILGKVVMSHPFLMNLSVEANLEPRMNFLVERCHLKERDAATLIKSSPGILCLSVEDNLRPTLDFLSNLLAGAINDDDDVADTTTLRKCVLGHPQLLALSLKNLQQKVDYFDAIDRMGSKSTNTSLACRVAIRSPVAYSLSLKHNIVPTVELLAKAWGKTPPELHWETDTLVLGETLLSQEKESLSSLLAEFPSILTLSLEGNIQPTLTFFNRTGYTCLDANWRLQSDNVASRRLRPIRGRYIAASLFNRLLPRWHHIIANGWPLGQGETPNLSALPPLHVLVGATDRAFCEQMGFEFQEYAQFKHQSVPKLKFSSQFDTWLKTGRPIDVA